MTDLPHPLTPVEDALREARIAEIGRRMVESDDRAARAQLWMEMKAEIEARSLEQVMRMERQRGLL